MNLLHALHLNNKCTTISLVGAGGKTTALFQLARDYLTLKNNKVFVSASTHLGEWQISNADHHVIFKDIDSLNQQINHVNGIILITGEIKESRTQPLDSQTLNWLRAKSKAENIPFLIEADGSREHGLKAPAEHEPAIPEFSDVVIHLSSLNLIGKPLNNENVHRAEIFSRLSNLPLHQTITSESILTMLKHPQGGLKNISSSMCRIAFLNQADSPTLQSVGGNMADQLLNKFDSVIVGSLKNKTYQTIEQTAGIILAAGGSTRYGSPKQLLDWKGKPFVRQVAETALHSGLSPVIVVTGIHHAEIESCLSDLPIKVIQNENHAQGQSSSIKTGLQALTPSALPAAGTSPKSTIESLENYSKSSSRFGGGRVGVGSAIFLLADQPQIPVEVIKALVESHSKDLQAILAPLVLEEKRANPVLFDKVAFSDLLQLTGDIGGRGIFDKHRVEYLPWHDDILLFDVDKPEDYDRLKEFE